MASYAPENNVLKTPENGNEAITNDLDLHSSLATQIAVIGVEEREIFPDNSLDSSNTISFTVDSSLNYLIKPDEIYLCGTYKVVDSNGNDIPEKVGGNDNPKAKVIPINFTSGTQWKSIHVKLNDQVIAEGTTLAAYKADLEERLFTDKQVKELQNYIRGWANESEAWENIPTADKATIFQTRTIVPETDKYSNLKNRYVLSQFSKEFKAISPLHIDICQQSKMLPPNAKLNISFSKHDTQNFNVLSDEDENYKIKIVNLYLKVTMKKIDPDILKEMIDYTIKGNPYTYPISRVEMLQFTKPAGGTDLTENNLFKINSFSPNRFFVVFVDQEAFTGSVKKDPLNYKNIDILTYRLVKSGNETVNSIVHCNRFDHDFYEPLHYLYNAVNLLPEAEEALGINLFNYDKRNFILAFKLGYTNASPLELSDIPEKTFYSLDIKLKTANANPLAMIVYAEYDAEIRVDAMGNVTRSDHAL